MSNREKFVMPENMSDFKIKPNIYDSPAEAIAPNGRYLIQFKVTKVVDRDNSAKDDSYSDNLNLDSQRIKKDALYKPLLRKFRAFLRKVFDCLGLSKGCNTWAPSRLLK